MTQFKTAFCFIAKDKSDILERLLNSTRGMFNLYCLADTGSSDDTIKVFINWCKANGKEYLFDKGQLIETPKKKNDYRFTVINNKRILADFSKAREVSFDLARGKVDFVFWADTDDIIVGAENIPAIVEKMDKNGIKFGLIDYIYAKVAKNSPKPVIQKREKLVDIRVPGHWVGRVHENYTSEGITAAPIGDIRVEHKRSPYEAMETERRNHQIMEEEVKELGIEKVDEKMLNDLAYDHWEWKEFDKAIEYYKVLLTRNIQNPELKFNVLTKIATAYVGKNQLEDALTYANKALVFAPLHPDSYVLLAELYANMNQFEEANYFAEKILKIGRPQTTNPINEMDYNILPLRIKAEFAIREGRLDDAISLLKDIYKILPNDEFRQNIARIEKDKLKKGAIESIHKMLLYFQNNNKFSNIGNLIAAIPKDLREEQNVRALIKEGKADYKRKTADIKFKGSKSIVFYAGGFFEQWDGDSDIKQGIGGSEGMCILMARELAKLGNKVFVYNETVEDHVVDGVTYINHQKWSSTIKCDIFVSLRRPDVFSQIISAKKQYLWLHDTYYGEVPMINLYSPNKLIVLSDAHKEIIKNGYGLGDDVFWQSRNAINPKAIPSVMPERNPYQLIYASSYDRGLDNLLNLYPKIKAQVPQASLKIFYGWNTYDMLMNQRQSQEMMNFKQGILKQISETEGVTELGRVSQTELYRQFAQSSIWFYPTEFYEISCINAMTAQVMGCIPVCTPVAALNETVGKYGFKTDLGRIADEIIYLLKHQKELDKRREPMQKWAKSKFNSETLALEWNEQFNNG